jgi:hypothetical protein
MAEKHSLTAQGELMAYQQATRTKSARLLGLDALGMGAFFFGQMESVAEVSNVFISSTRSPDFATRCITNLRNNFGL